MFKALSFFVLTFYPPLFAQNLVPNGGFEELYTSPPNFENFEVVKFWYKGNFATVDIWWADYNAISFLNAHAYEGQNFCGIVTIGRTPAPDLSQNIISWYEYPQIELTTTLKKDSLYLFSFQALQSNLAYVSTDQFGFRLLDTAEVIQNWGPKLNTNALVANERVPYDNQWHYYAWYYKAQGGEKFLEIGAYPSVGKTNVNAYKIPELCCASGPEITQWGDTIGYLFIDDVKLYPISLRIPNVVTTNNDDINDCFQFIENLNMHLNIVDRWGISVFDSKKDTVFPTPQMQESSRADGVYFWVLTLNEKLINNGFIHLLNN
jgi:hypothetical protein